MTDNLPVQASIADLLIRDARYFRSNTKRKLVRRFMGEVNTISKEYLEKTDRDGNILSPGDPMAYGKALTGVTLLTALAKAVFRSFNGTEHLSIMRDEIAEHENALMKVILVAEAKENDG